MKKKVLSIVLAAAMIISVLLVGMVSVSAAEDGKIKKNSVTFNYSSSETEELPEGAELSEYIAQKKAEFEDRVRTIAGANGDIADYSQYFSANTYAVVDKVSFGNVYYEQSDDAIVIGDLDNWENLYVVSGWIARVTNYVVNYKLVTVDESAPVGGVIDEVELTVTVPTAGTNSKTSPPQVEIDSENCSLENAVWIRNPNEYTTEVYDVDFEENKGYYMLVTIRADDGYTFEKTGKPYDGIDEGFDNFDGCVVNYGSALFAGSKTVDGVDYLRLKISVVVPKTTFDDMSYIHVLSTEGGQVDFWSDEYDGDWTQPYGVPQGAEVTLTAISESGYIFKGWYKGDVNASSYDEMFTDELITTENPYVFNSYNYPYICAKFEYTGVQRQGDQIQVWVADGGKASVEYTPTWNDDGYIKPKDGNNYVSIGEVVAFWKGDEITVNAKPDEGYKFKGWYHVRIEWGPGDELPKYEGDVISTGISYTYKPGVTVVPGDSEPLRYICAVFEEIKDGQGVTGDANGDGNVDILDASIVQKAAVDKVTLTAEQKALCDVNGDGNVDALDAAMIQKFAAGKITEFKKK